MNIYIKKIIFFIIISLIGIVSFACPGKKNPDLSPEPSRKILKSVPDWYSSIPTREGFRYQVGAATSQDLQMAVDKAALGASNALAGELESQMNAQLKRMREEIGIDENSKISDQFSSVQEQIIARSLKDYSIIKKEIQEARSDGGDIYRAYVLIEWDEGAEQERLLNRIKENEAIHTMMRSTELYDEMEKKVEAYRKSNQ